jgi:hypothetical protein
MNKCGQDERNEITPKGLGNLALSMQSPNHFQGSFMYMTQQCCVVVGFQIVYCDNWRNEWTSNCCNDS